MRKPPRSAISLVHDISVIKYTGELRDRRFSRYADVHQESQIKIENENKDCISYLSFSILFIRIKSTKIFKL